MLIADDDAPWQALRMGCDESADLGQFCQGFGKAGSFSSLRGVRIGVIMSSSEPFA